MHVHYAILHMHSAPKGMKKEEQVVVKLVAVAQQFACSSSSNPTGTSTTTDSETRIIHRNVRITSVN